MVSGCLQAAVAKEIKAKKGKRASSSRRIVVMAYGWRRAALAECKRVSTGVVGWRYLLTFAHNSGLAVNGFCKIYNHCLNLMSLCSEREPLDPNRA